MLVRALASGHQMKTKDFQIFVEQLGDLSESQQQVVAADAVGTKIILISHDTNKAKRIAGDIKLPTDDEGVHPLSRSD